MQTKEHHFIVEEATKYGVEKAILLYNIRFWLDKNKANEKNIYQHSDGKYYYFTYNSGKAFEKLFPYMKSRSINQRLTELEKDGVLISGNFNKTPYDRTKWYSIIQEFETKNENSTSKNGEWNGNTCESNSKVCSPIPYNNTDNNTYRCAADAAPHTPEEPDSTNLFSDTPDSIPEPTDLSTNKDKQMTVKEVGNPLVTPPTCENPPLLKEEEEVFDFQSKVNLMLKNGKDVRMPIIATYWKIKGLSFDNKKQYKAGLKRDLRSAGNLSGYSLERIQEVMVWLNGTQIDWKLETVHKYIDKDLSTLNGKLYKRDKTLDYGGPYFNLSERNKALDRADEDYKLGKMNKEELAKIYVAIFGDTLENEHNGSSFAFNDRQCDDQEILKFKHLFPNF